MKLSQLSILFILPFIHSFVQANPLKVGSWMGNLNLQNTHELIFQFEVDPNQKITIKNGGEIVEMKDYQIENDSIKDRKSTRLNSSHVRISYAVFCLKKKKKIKKNIKNKKIRHRTAVARHIEKLEGI